MLKSISCSIQGSLIKGLAQQPQADGQPIAILAAGQAHGRQPGNIRRHGKDIAHIHLQGIVQLFPQPVGGGGGDGRENDRAPLKNAVEFSDLEAQDLLTHRVDLEAVDIDATKDEIAELFTASHFSRLLVYEESIDKIIGVIHRKDFYVGNGITSKEIKDIITTPLFVMPAEKISRLLKLLQANKSHIAVVIDEYGGTLGIVTMEDILEELVGEIWDEHDEVEEPFHMVDPNTYILEGDVTFDDFCSFFNVKGEADSVSIAGWIMEQMGKIPEQGDSFTYGNLTVSIEQISDNRILKVRVTMPDAIAS